jgi:hypothetical protein
MTVVQPTEHYETGEEKERGKERQAMQSLGDGDGAIALVEKVDGMGETEALYIKPLAVMGAGETQPVSPD